MRISILLISILMTCVLEANFSPLEEQLLKDLEIQKELFKKKDKETRKIKSLLYQTAKKIEKLNDQEREIQESMLITKSKVNESLSGLRVKKSIIQEQRRKILKRFRLLSVWYKAGVGDLLFSSKSVKDLDKRMFYLRKIMATDASQLTVYSSDVRLFDKEKKALRIRIKKMAKMKANLKSKQSQLSKIKRYHKNILAKVYRDRKKAFKKLANMRTKSFQILKEKMNRGSFFELKRKLSLPVEGKIVQNFGVIPKERKRVSLYSNGIKIEVKKEQYVKAVSSGKLIFSDHMRGYGKTVVIDHGDRYYTVYSNLSKVYSKVGDEIKESYKFAKIGSLRQEIDTHLYFEIRKFSEALNPVNWIKKQDLKIALNQSVDASM